MPSVSTGCPRHPKTISPSSALPSPPAQRHGLAYRVVADDDRRHGVAKHVGGGAAEIAVVLAQKAVRTDDDRVGFFARLVSTIALKPERACLTSVRTGAPYGWQQTPGVIQQDSAWPSISSLARSGAGGG